MSTFFFFLIILTTHFINICTSNSCINYQDPSTCNIESKCSWDSTLSQCICNSEISPDVVIAMDSSGSVMSHGWRIQKEFVIDLISGGIPHTSSIGIVQFASNSWIRYQFTDNQNRTSLINKVNNLTYTRGWTYMKDAVTDALFLFKHQSTSPHKKFVLITDGNPIPISQTPCDLVSNLTDLGIEVMIIGVGDSWTRARIDCLVRDKDKDIIEVVGFTNISFAVIRNETDEWLCRDISFLLTEVKPVLGNQTDNNNIYHPIPFIELYNSAKDIDLNLYHFEITGLFTVHLNNALFLPNNNEIVHSVYDTIWPFGTYLVIYDNTADVINSDTVWCFDCLCDLIQPTNRLCNESIYIGCSGITCQYNPTGEPQVDNWDVLIYDQTEPLNSRLILNISHGIGSQSWITIDIGFTYELRDIHCNMDSGLCWSQSCTVYGTPGYSPIDCVDKCIDVNCQIGGDPNAQCNDTSNLCECNEWCYNINSLPSCNCILPPANCSVIVNTSAVNVIPAGNAEWWPPSIDWGNHYTLWYEVRWYTFYGDEHSEKMIVTPTNQRAWTLFNMEYRYPDLWGQYVRAYVDFGDNPNTPQNDPQIYYSQWTQCIIRTMEPTPSPTPSPTLGLPPIDQCNVTIIQSAGLFTVINIEWTVADVSHSHTFNDNQFNNGYKLYFTKMDTYIPGTDDLAVFSTKVYNQTFYIENLHDYDAEMLIDEGKLQISVSVVVHKINDTTTDLDDDDLHFNELMYQQSTICDWFTLSPTLAPSKLPTVSPTNIPSISPTYQPTQAPTYAYWVLDACVIIIKNQEGTVWNISWIESDPNDNILLPETRKIFVYKNDEEINIFTEDQFSSQIIDGYEIPLPYNTDDNTIFIQAEHLINGNDPTLIKSPHIAVCVVYTLSPTDTPTQSPTTSQPTKSPIPVPTFSPTLIPTQAPTYYVPIEWCTVFIIDGKTYHITFQIPEFKEPWTPAEEDVVYQITYTTEDGLVDSDYTAPPSDDNDNDNDDDDDDDDDDDNDDNDEEDVYSNTITINNEDIIISASTNFTLRAVSNDLEHVEIYSSYAICNLLTYEPTLNPTDIPTVNPTPPPTHPPVGIFVYSDNGALCEDDERCACVAVKDSDYNCIGSDYPDGTQIKNYSVLSQPSGGISQQILLIGRYPYYLPYDVKIWWEFVSLNDSEDIGPLLSPMKGTSIIKGGEHLGELVYAEFLPVPDETQVYTNQWYRFNMISCVVSNTHDTNDECSFIYPSWAYIVWIPPAAFSAIIVEAGEILPDWIFYLLLGASVAGVIVAIGVYEASKIKNMNKAVAAQNLEAATMLDGIDPSAHTV